MDKAKHEADYVEFVFQDQYLGRNEMWRIGEQLAGQCLHVGQEVSFIGAVVARVDAIYVRGDNVGTMYLSVQIAYSWAHRYPVGWSRLQQKVFSERSRRK